MKQIRAHFDFDAFSIFLFAALLCVPFDIYIVLLTIHQFSVDVEEKKQFRTHHVRQ